MIDYFNPGNIKYTKAIFFDRDGTIIVDTIMPYKEEDMLFFEDTISAMREASILDAYIILITNQSGIALGKYSEEQMKDFNRLMIHKLEGQGVRINALLYCPHYDVKNFPIGYTGCDCSKPKPGLLLEAKEMFDLQLEESILVGDKHTDIGAGILANCKSNILATTGIYKHGTYENEALAKTYIPSHIVSNLTKAVGIVKEVIG